MDLQGAAPWSCNFRHAGLVTVDIYSGPSVSEQSHSLIIHNYRSPHASSSSQLEVSDLAIVKILVQLAIEILRQSTNAIQYSAHRIIVRIK